ncbi:hypothetical protein B0H13DRAFT_1895771 [Mycena leptocephala]|nr:hypothetical protein B0H13DRAFT_1895771 [Mycena leptocephala]
MERELGDNHADTLDAMERLAWTYHEVGQFRQAKVLRFTVLRNEEPFWEMSCNTYHQLGQYEKAAELKLSPGKAEETSGNIHRTRPIHTGRGLKLEVLKSEDLLGEEVQTLFLHGRWHNISRPGSAEEILVKITRNFKAMLAGTYYTLGQFMQAEELYVGALEKHRKVLGEDIPQTIWIMRNLALTYHSLDKVPEAEELERLVAYHDV